MSRLRPALVFQHGFTLLLMALPASAEIVVLSGSGGVAVQDDDGSVSDNIPWTQLGSTPLSAQWRELYATGTLGFAAGFDSLSLSFSGSHSIRRTLQEFHSEMSSSIGGGFWIMSDLDLLVSTVGTMAFSLHGQEDPGAGMFVHVADQNQDVIYQKGAVSSYGSSDGTLGLVDSILLDGGMQYFIFFGSEVSQVAVGFSDLPSTATSEMTLAIQAVPEPSTLLLLAGTSLVALRWKLNKQIQRTASYQMYWKRRRFGEFSMA